MFFLTSLVNGGAGLRERRPNLLPALAASLVLHLLLLSLIRLAGNPAGEGTPGRGTAAAGLALSVRVSQQAQQASHRAPLPVPALEGDAALPDAPALPPAPEEGVVAATLGHRRLAEYRPPYLAQAEVVASPPGGWYFPRAQLTVEPRLQDEPALDLPDSVAGGAPRAGKLVLRVFVGFGGAVDRVEISQSSLPTEYEEAAVAAFAAVRFRPGELEGVPVSSELRFEIAFDPSLSGSSHLTGSFRLPPRTEAAAKPGPPGTAKGASRDAAPQPASAAGLSAIGGR